MTSSPPKVVCALEVAPLKVDRQMISKKRNERSDPIVPLGSNHRRNGVQSGHNLAGLPNLAGLTGTDVLDGAGRLLGGSGAVAVFGAESLGIAGHVGR